MDCKSHEPLYYASWNHKETGRKKNREGKENLEENYFWNKGILCKANTVAVEITETLAFNIFLFNEVP